ncbi:MAG TPA: flagellar filament capping protein FliD [Azospirillaceae bacterium]|nr:flagellar filament capping protein FliD [Azospirillaceae bacterium]HRQ80988.1 flagellar filament capping protein FliD [Azospirillaceae bacterium]
MTSVSSSTSTTAAAAGYSALTSTGSGTGLDYSALIEAKVAARLTRADKLDVKIETNEAKAAAYENLQSLLQTLASGIDGLRNRTASTGASSNLFSEMTAYLSNDDALAVTADEDAEAGTYSVVVQQLATKHKIGGSETASRTDALGLSGSFSLSAGDGTATAIAIDSDDSLVDIKDAINEQTAATGVAASIIQVSEGGYKLILTSSDTGEEISLTDGGDGVSQSLGLLDASGNIADELTAAQNAVITVDGVEITRSSNVIDDAIDGLMFNLYEADAGETISVEIATDLAQIKSAITDFVDSYNAYRDFVLTQQTLTDDGAVSEDSALFSDTLLKTINTQVYQALNATVDYDGEKLSIANLLGVTFEDDNTLSVDEDTLNSALTDNLDKVKALLGLTMTASSSQLSLLRYNTQADSLSFKLDIDVAADGTLNSASVGGDASLFTVSGNRIIGAEGSMYAGLVLVYTGSSGSVDVDLRQGVMDQLYATLDAAADSTDSDLADALSDIDASNYTLETRANNIKEQAESYRSRLTSYYARLEAAAETANLLLQQLNYSDDDE